MQERGGISYQEWVLRLPVRLGGFGFRSLEDTVGMAFIGALEQAVPAFCGQNGVCSQLEEVMGGEDCLRVRTCRPEVESDVAVKVRGGGGAAQGVAPTERGGGASLYLAW